MTTETIYIVGAAVFLIASAIFFIISKVKLQPYHPLYYLMLAVPVTAGVAYVVMSTGFGIVSTDLGAVNITRYVDWFITTPILLYILTYALYKGSSRTQLRQFLIIGGLDILMLLTGLGAELTTGNWRTLFFSVSSIAFLVMLYFVLDSMLSLQTRESNPRLKKITLAMAWTILALWSVYPFIWLFSSHGLQVLSEVGVTSAFLVLDLITKFGFALFLLYYLAIATNNSETNYE